MSHLSTLTLHRIRYGELEGEPLTDARAHLDTCARCSARLQAQEAHRSAFVLQPVPAAIRAAAPPPEASPGWLSETFAKIRMGWLAAPLLAAIAATAASSGAADDGSAPRRRDLHQGRRRPPRGMARCGRRSPGPG